LGITRKLLHHFTGHYPVADAILDRIVHNAYKLSLKGESMRKAIGAGISNEERSET